jgi:hypothetical protein
VKYTQAWNLLRGKMRLLHFAGDESMKPWYARNAVFFSQKTVFLTETRFLWEHRVLFAK